MKLHVISSSSAGNGYILETNNSALILECGVPFHEITKRVDFDKLDFGVCSHSHGDHAKYLREYLHRGIRIANNVAIHHNSIGITNREMIKMGEWFVIPLTMIHDVECYGFLINHVEYGSILFATDTEQMPYKFKGLRHIIIEANYSQETLDNRQLDNKINGYLASRVEKSHLSFEQAKSWIESIDKSDLQSVTFIHLSSGNSSKAEMYVDKMQQSIGVPCRIAEKNSMYYLNF